MVTDEELKTAKQERFKGEKSKVWHSIAPHAVSHFLVLILNLTVIRNFITVPLCDCEIGLLCFNYHCIQSIVGGAL